MTDEAIPFEDAQQNADDLDPRYDPAAWDRAPYVPLYQWFDPPLLPTPPEQLGEHEFKDEIDLILRRLAEKNFFICSTDHLSDRELYETLYDEVLPQPEKFVDDPDWSCHWNLAEDTDVWLTYYATDEEREEWAADETEIPPKDVPLYPRVVPEYRHPG